MDIKNRQSTVIDGLKENKPCKNVNLEVEVDNLESQTVLRLPETAKVIEGGNTSCNDSYECIKCSKRFKWKQSLALHFNRKHGILLHNCECCGLQFASKHILLIHLQKKHNLLKKGRKKSIHQCHICGKTFNYPTELRR